MTSNMRNTGEQAYKPTRGVRIDLKRLMNAFLSTATVRFEKFSEIWRNYNMSYLCAGRNTDRETREFIERVLLISTQYFLPPYQFQVRVGGLYLLYAVYQIQPISPKAKIRIISSQWEDSLNFLQQATQQSHLDVVYIFNKLIQEQAFQFCFLPAQITWQSEGRNFEDEEIDLADEMKEERSLMNKLFNYESMEQLSYLQDQYHRMKVALSGQGAIKPDKSLDVLKHEFVEDVVMSLQSFKEKVKDITQPSRTEKPVSPNSSPEKKSVGTRRHALKQRAYIDHSADKSSRWESQRSPVKTSLRKGTKYGVKKKVRIIAGSKDDDDGESTSDNSSDEDYVPSVTIRPRAKPCKNKPSPAKKETKDYKTDLIKSRKIERKLRRVIDNGKFGITWTPVTEQVYSVPTQRKSPKSNENFETCGFDNISMSEPRTNVRMTRSNVTEPVSNRLQKQVKSIRNRGSPIVKQNQNGRKDEQSEIIQTLSISPRKAVQSPKSRHDQPEGETYEQIDDDIPQSVESVQGSRKRVIHDTHSTPDRPKASPRKRQKRSPLQSTVSNSSPKKTPLKGKRNKNVQDADTSTTPNDEIGKRLNSKADASPTVLVKGAKKGTNRTSRVSGSPVSVHKESDSVKTRRSPMMSPVSGSTASSKKAVLTNLHNVSAAKVDDQIKNLVENKRTTPPISLFSANEPKDSTSSCKRSAPKDSTQEDSQNKVKKSRTPQLSVTPVLKPKCSAGKVKRSGKKDKTQKESLKNVKKKRGPQLSVIPVPDVTKKGKNVAENKKTSEDSVKSLKKRKTTQDVLAPKSKRGRKPHKCVSPEDGEDVTKAKQSKSKTPSPSPHRKRNFGNSGVKQSLAETENSQTTNGQANSKESQSKTFELSKGNKQHIAESTPSSTYEVVTGFSCNREVTSKVPITQAKDQIPHTLLQTLTEGSKGCKVIVVPKNKMPLISKDGRLQITSAQFDQLKSCGTTNIIKPGVGGVKTSDPQQPKLMVPKKKSKYYTINPLVQKLHREAVGSYMASEAKASASDTTTSPQPPTTKSRSARPAAGNTSNSVRFCNPRENVQDTNTDNPRDDVQDTNTDDSQEEMFQSPTKSRPGNFAEAVKHMIKHKKKTSAKQQASSETIQHLKTKFSQRPLDETEDDDMIIDDADGGQDIFGGSETQKKRKKHTQNYRLDFANAKYI